MISIENAIKFPFKESNWTKTVGIYFVILLVIAAITFILQIFFQLPSEILNAIAEESSDTGLRIIASGANVAYLAASGIVSLISLPVTLYLSGYIYDVVRHIKNEKNPAVTEHGSYLFRMKLGLVRMIIALGLGLISLIALVIPTIVLIAGSLTLETSAGLAFVLLAFGFILSLGWLAFTMLGTKLVQYAMEYIYLESGFKALSNLSRVFKIIRLNFKNLLMLFAVEFLVQMINAFAFVICCLVFFVQPAVTTALTFSLAYYYGETFRSIKEV